MKLTLIYYTVWLSSTATTVVEFDILISTFCDINRYWMRPIRALLTGEQWHNELLIFIYFKSRSETFLPFLDILTKFLYRKRLTKGYQGTISITTTTTTTPANINNTTNITQSFTSVITNSLASFYRKTPAVVSDRLSKWKHLPSASYGNYIHWNNLIKETATRM